MKKNLLVDSINKRDNYLSIDSKINRIKKHRSKTNQLNLMT